MGLFPKRDRDTFDYVPKGGIINEEGIFSDEGIIPIGKRQNINQSPYALTPEEVKHCEPEKPQKIEDIPMQSAGESLYQRMINVRKTQNVETDKKSEEIKKQTESLLSKCSQFVAGDDTPKEHDNNTYALDSIEDIIAAAEKRAQEKINNIYGASNTGKTPIQSDKTGGVMSQATANNFASQTVKVPIKPVESEEKFKPVFDTSYIGANTDHTYKSTEEKSSAAHSDGTIKQAEKSAVPAGNTETAEHISDNSQKNQAAEDTEFGHFSGFYVGPAVPPEKIDMKRDNDVKNLQYSFADGTSADKYGKAEESTISFDPVDKKEQVSSFAENITRNIDIPLDLEPTEDDNVIDEISVDDEEVFGDYTCPDDAAPIRKSLRSGRVRLTVRLIFTAIITVALCVLEPAILTFSGLTGSAAITAVKLALLALAAIVNIDIFKSIPALFGKKPNTDLSAAICTLCVAAYGIFCAIKADYTSTQFCFVPSMCMAFSVIGKLNTVKRVKRNFEQIAEGDEKKAVTLINDKDGGADMANGAIEGETLVAVGKNTKNILHFLKNSYEVDPFASNAVLLAVIGLVISVIMSVYGAVKGGVAEALRMLAVFSCLSAPLTCGLIGTLPLKLAASRLNCYGAALTGYSSAMKIERANAVVINVKDLFPRGTVKLFNLKVLSPNDLEKTIFNAAAVCTDINSPLGHVFRRIARTSESYSLPKADSVKYENRLGISGWVNDESVLIGNRSIMESHGIAVPSVEVDKKILRKGYFPVYVASNGKPCALLIVGYENDPEITYELRRLCNTGVTVLVDNCDPNVTEEMICDYFGVYRDTIKVMSAKGSKIYKNCTAYEESVSAPACYAESACGLASVVTASIKIKKLTAVMTALHIIGFITGIVAAAAMIIAGFSSLITPFTAACYLVICAGITCIAPYGSRP